MRSRTLRSWSWAVLASAACGSDKPASTPGAAPSAPLTVAHVATADPGAAARLRMVEETIVARGVRDPRVLEAMRRTRRHELVPAALRHRAYEDNPLPIGYEQTISQPFIVAAMTEAAQVAPGEKVLEVGTGSGYQAAVLAELGADVYSIEIVEPLATRTHAVLATLGYDQLHLRIGDGYRGWPEAAPFDAIIVTAAPPEIPTPLIEQLAIGGRLVIPVGDYPDQELRVVTRRADGTTSETLFPVRFVPMTGEAQRAPG
ncbi:MAG: protein-L-isoaspartate(D-aspartate) O-methyltransferase [Deltaproteobacteria bacterium]|nr:protein-L-isoaspartate(D-aspartate) O-methyltransferase [Deltaproteobacteria bacterium]